MRNVVQFMRPNRDEQEKALWDEQEQLMQLKRYIAERQKHIELELMALQGVKRV